MFFARASTSLDSEPHYVGRRLFKRCVHHRSLLGHVANGQNARSQVLIANLLVWVIGASAAMQLRHEWDEQALEFASLNL